MNKTYTLNSIGIKDVTFGSNVQVVEPLNLYGCSIGDNTFIGPFVEIQNDVKIGNNCKISSKTIIGPNVTVGDNCILSNCKIQNSIIMSNCTIDSEIDIEKSIIAYNCKILQNSSLTDTHKFLLGEGTTLSL